MFDKYKLVFMFLFMLNFSAFAQNLETLAVKIIDQNNDLVTAGIIKITNSKGKKLTESKLKDAKKLANINLEIGYYDLEVQALGFKPYKQNIEIKIGQNNLEIKLELAEIKVDVDVQQSEIEKRLDEVFGGFLSAEEIAKLPESGEEIKEELKRRYGDDILIRIDGDFDGSQVPSKSEISSIKVIRNSFDAEFHEIGRIIIDIRTNVVAEKIRGFVNFNFNNSALNARNPFDLKRQPANSNSILAFISGPLIKKKTSFNLSVISLNRTATQRFIGTGFNETVTPQKFKSLISITNFGIKHTLPQNHTLNLKYQNLLTVLKNVGLGAFDLPERGADRKNIQHKFSVIESGIFKKKYVNDFMFDFTISQEKSTPKSDNLTIFILNAYNQGSSGTRSQNDRNKFRIADNLLFDVKKHSLKFGFEIEHERLKSENESNLNGAFTFLNLNDFNNQRPSQYSQTLGRTEFNLNQTRTSFYFQDYFKTKKNVQLSLGVRYEWQNDVKDYNNFSPRFGYVWSPTKDAKFVVRGGAGIFYEWFDTSILSAILSNDGRQGQRIIIRNPSFPNPFIGNGTSQFLPNNVSRLADDLSTPYILVSQTGINYKFNKTLTFEGIYTFRKGLHHFRSRNINAPINGIRPNLNFGLINLLESSGKTLENSFELKTNYFFKGVNMFANYQLSKNVADFASALSLPMDNYNLRLEKGLSSLDQTHRLTISFNREVFKKSLSISPSIRIESGFPYTITTGRDDNADTVFNDRPNGIRRNTERGELLKQVDLQFRWKVPMNYLGLKKDSRRAISLNLNARNLFNTANLTNYVGTQTSPFFNKPTSARNPRSIEIGMSFNF
jgi:hypothetical protein